MEKLKKFVIEGDNHETVEKIKQLLAEGKNADNILYLPNFLSLPGYPKNQNHKKH